MTLDDLAHLSPSQQVGTLLVLALILLMLAPNDEAVSGYASVQRLTAGLALAAIAFMIFKTILNVPLATTP